MLIRLRNYEEAFMSLVDNDKLVEALLFLKRYKVNIGYISVETSDNLKRLIEKNKSIIMDYLNP